ncbi:hypothetical protein CPTSV76_201 [Enterobacteria phage SV76]|nr:hypothetical protein CPTSV76_201 [Enterobacteria phage SV76]
MMLILIILMSKKTLRIFLLVVGLVISDFLRSKF